MLMTQHDALQCILVTLKLYTLCDIITDESERKSKRHHESDEVKQKDKRVKESGHTL